VKLPFSHRLIYFVAILPEVFQEVGGKLKSKKNDFFFGGEVLPFLKKLKKKTEEAAKKGLEVGEKATKKGVKVGKKAGKKGVELGKKGVKKTKEAVE